jgi:hypothetical protein
MRRKAAAVSAGRVLRKGLPPEFVDISSLNLEGADASASDAG